MKSSVNGFECRGFWIKEFNKTPHFCTLSVSRQIFKFFFFFFFEEKWKNNTMNFIEKNTAKYLKWYFMFPSTGISCSYERKKKKLARESCTEITIIFSEMTQSYGKLIPVYHIWVWDWLNNGQYSSWSKKIVIKK